MFYWSREALLRHDLWELVSYAHSLKDFKIISKNNKLHKEEKPLNIQLISNGQNIDLNALQLCKKYNMLLSMSLPGLNTYPLLTSGGSADKVLNNFNLAKSINLRTVVNITVTLFSLFLVFIFFNFCLQFII